MEKISKIIKINILIFFYRLRREYTGDWINDKKTGRGTMFFKNEDRYDG